MKGSSSWFPWAIVAIPVLVFLAVAWPHTDARDSWHWREFGSLPVVNEDTVARLDLMSISYRQTYDVGEIDADTGIEKRKKTYPAIQWLLETMVSMGKGPSRDYRIFRIENDQLLNLLELKKRDGLRYSLNELLPHMEVLGKEAGLADKVEPKHRDHLQKAILELGQHVNLYTKLSRLEAPLMVPVDAAADRWIALVQNIQDVQEGVAPMQPATEAYLQMLVAFQKGNVSDFNKAVDDYRGEVEKSMPDALRRTRLEHWFNEASPFYYCSFLYALVALLGCISWLGWFTPLNRAALGCMIVIFAVHTFSLLARMYIQGRPPVTNLYSSAIFIGWGCVLTCLTVELLFRNSLALVVGSTTGALSLVVAHYLSLDGDTLGMLQAVLDTNFWLATHVVCITFGYTATFVAGFMGVAYVVLGVATPLLARGNATALSKMMYGVICFAMFLSFTGTVLGGIWADQSWGRFWGWDPKENGALLIVIWNALILHARWGGMVKQRGVAQLAVLGNAVTAWSWFGTNLLGVGLHSYGFMQGAMTVLIGFCLLQVAICALGFIPLRHWRSFQPLSARRSVHDREPQFV
jgi:ABC-type transport system involved in cytochrome c biogenesis permease subunit